QTLTSADINPWSPDRDALMTVFESARKGPFIPLSETPTLIFPGCDGGAEWGGTAVDPDGVMYVNSNEMAWLFTMSRKTQSSETGKVDLGELLYQKNCAACHRTDRTGNPASDYPALKGIGERMAEADIRSIIRNGSGRMVGFPGMEEAEITAVVRYLQG